MGQESKAGEDLEFQLKIITELIEVEANIQPRPRGWGGHCYNQDTAQGIRTDLNFCIAQ